ARPPARLNTAFVTPEASKFGNVVGAIPNATTIATVGNTVCLSPPIDLMDWLKRERSGQTEGGRTDRFLLPCVVFRYQLPNEIFPVVSGDVVQVAPLISGIASRTENISGINYTVVYDPYFSFGTGDRKVRLIPPHPLIDEATYRYLLVLFRPDGEIDSVVPTTTFRIDLTPN
ncbi:MAG: hypothetical protein K9N23_19510, partial [Akkermansiaceae bacterium]|nr:hypothetical protein [Akkermansiaceae bacterium]